jgi:hypothetical protein
MATTKFNPTYRPFKTSHHAIMGAVDHYMSDAPLRFTSGGAQASFIRNNARANTPREYGIKLFPNVSQAFAAYQRQKIAADAGAAPPVRRMVCFSHPGMVYNREQDRYVRATVLSWGYQTCVAYSIGIEAMEVPWDMEEMTNPPLSMIPERRTRELYKLMRSLSTAGTQIDGKPLGTIRRRSRRMVYDLHRDNIGFWRKRPVVIDFGYHIVQEAC